MTPFDLITFDETGFRKEGDRPDLRVWRSDYGDGMGLYYFAIPPNIPVPLDQIDALRASIRSMLTAAGGAIIELEVVDVNGVPSIRQIIKKPQQPTGMTYVGSFTFPFRDRSLVLKIQCEERGVTGMREAVVLDQLLGNGSVTISDGKVEGWSADPYDASIQLPLMRNLAEDSGYDAQFPDHPLSRARRAMTQLQTSLRLHDALRDLPPFDGPSAAPPPPAPKRPWWRFGR